MSPAQNPPVERHHGTISLAPRIYEGGGPRSGRGSPPAAAGTALSVTASPCQLSQRESQGSCAPITGHSEPVLLSGVGISRMRGTAERQALPPAFMRGEGHAVAGGVLRRSGDGPLSHGFAVPALPKGEPRGLRPVLAPRIYEGGGPRSGRGSSPAAAAGKASSVTASPCQLPQRGSRGAVVVPRSHSTGGFPRQCAHSLGMTGNRLGMTGCRRTASEPQVHQLPAPPVLHFPGDYGTMQNVSF